MVHVEGCRAEVFPSIDVILGNTHYIGKARLHELHRTTGCTHFHHD